MVEQLYALAVQVLADGEYVVDGLLPVLGAGTILFFEVGHGDVLAAQYLVVLGSGLQVAAQRRKRYVARYCLQTQLVQLGADFFRTIAVKARELYTVIAHVGDLLEGAHHVGRGVVAHRVNLYCYRKHNRMTSL